MDDGGIIVFGILLVGYLLIAPIVALVRSSKAKRRVEQQDERIARLTTRLFDAETKVKTLESQVRAAAEARARAVIPVEPLAQAPAETETSPEPASAREQAAQPIEAASLEAETPTSKEVTPAGAAPVEPGSAPSGFLASEQGSAPIPAQAIPKFFPKPAAASSPVSASSQQEKWVNFEELLGANFLNKIGTAVFVIGVALFLSYSMRHLGPAGKIAVGYTVAACLLGFGLWGELHDRYRILSRAVLGGGWAIAYFTTYAVSNVRAVRLVTNPTLGFALLFVVAAAMVLHSLRFHSEATTGFAYLLAFASVAVSKMSLGTLTASALLAASLAVVLWRRRWYSIEPFAIAATYTVHFLWLRQVFHAIGGRKPFPEFGPSAALITVYWAIWMVSYFLRDEEEPRSRNILTGSFLLNAAGYLIVLHYQSFHPEWRFWFLLAAGAVYMALAPLATKRNRRRAFILTTTIGAAMIAAAFPYRYGGARVEIVWLLESEVLLVAGWRLAEKHFRNLGWLTSAALSIYVLFHDLALRRAVWRPPDRALGITLFTLGAAFYLQAKLFPRWLGENATSIDGDSARASIVVATFFVLAAAWVGLPFLVVGTAWAITAVVLAEWGRRSIDADLQFSGHGAAVLAAARLLSNDLPWAEVYHLLGWFTVGLAACMFYLVSRRIARPASVEGTAKAPTLFDEWPLLASIDLRAVYTWTATLIAVLLIWRELSVGAIALGWATLGLVLLEAARTLRDRQIGWQSLLLFSLSFLRIFFADLNVEDYVGHVPARVISVAALALIYYYAALSSAAEDTAGTFSEARRRNLYFWLGWGALVSLARFELATAWVVVGWAAMTVTLFVVGRAADVRALRYQSYALTVLLGVRCAFDNFYQTGAGPLHLKLRTVTVVLVSVALYALLAIALAARRSSAAAPQKSGGPPVPAPVESGND